VWQVASTNLQHLPDVSPALAKCIGLSKLQLACIAAHLLRSGSAAAVDTGGLVNAWRAVTDSAARFSAEQRHQVQPFKVVDGLSQLELSTLLMQLAADCDSSTEQFVHHSTGAVSSLLAALVAFKECNHHHHRQQQQQQQQSTAVLTQQADLQLARLLTKWADSAVPVLLKIMTKLLDRAQDAAPRAVTGVAADPASAGGSSNSGSSGSSADVLQAVLASLGTCVQLLAVLGKATAVETDRDAAAGGHVQGSVCAPIWGECAVQVVSVLEAFVRLLLLQQDTERLGSGVTAESCAALQSIHSLCVFGREGRAGLLLLLAVQEVGSLAAGSTGQRQGTYLRGLMSLLVSTLKLVGSGKMPGRPEGMRTCVATVILCMKMLEHLAAPLEIAAASTNSTAAAGVGGSGSSSGAVQQQPCAARYLVCLPWLVLLGRSCFYAGLCLLAALQVIERASSNTMLAAATNLQSWCPHWQRCCLAHGLRCSRVHSSLWQQGMPWSQCSSSLGCCKKHRATCMIMRLFRRASQSRAVCGVSSVGLRRSCACSAMLPAAFLCLSSATALLVGLPGGRPRLSWCWGAAACAAGALLRTTAAVIASFRIGRNTSLHARHWRQQQQQQQRMRRVVGADCVCAAEPPACMQGPGSSGG
jgi:hypothetical protein